MPHKGASIEVEDPHDIIMDVCSKNSEKEKTLEPEVIDEMPSIPDIPQIESAEALPSLPPPPPPESKGTIQPTEIKVMTAETQEIETQEPEI